MSKLMKIAKLLNNPKVRKAIIEKGVPLIKNEIEKRKNKTK
ncbi:hypothetical protein [Ureibacillus acetophenoni]|uniref:Uncharacterized protein n=1 Tax=Ureibacillus acetophenoni TaxID=614649 RepID=A0A285UJT8_9BACL|nr:hypothetical protein [Ureibacillus acetophenoni]SOC40866.1 hypothetical protein SAMN05877842_10912 [Ureibacillus acetophenoni]